MSIPGPQRPRNACIPLMASRRDGVRTPRPVPELQPIRGLDGAIKARVIEQCDRAHPPRPESLERQCLVGVGNQPPSSEARKRL